MACQQTKSRETHTPPTIHVQYLHYIITSLFTHSVRVILGTNSNHYNKGILGTFYSHQQGHSGDTIHIYHQGNSENSVIYRGILGRVVSTRTRAVLSFPSSATHRGIFGRVFQPKFFYFSSSVTCRGILGI